VTRFALVVPFPDLAPIVDAWRERTCVSKPSNGVPPHVTLLVPCPGDVAAVERVLEGFPAFDVTFGDVGRFSGALWLAPEPREPFRRMIAALADRFPDHPPYGGAFADVVPHLTVAQADLDDAEAELRPQLPQHVRAREALLLEEVAPQRWRSTSTFPLAGD
jgi:2'-5' RNA ligase